MLNHSCPCASVVHQNLMLENEMMKRNWGSAGKLELPTHY